MRLIPLEGDPIVLSDEEDNTILGRQPARGHAIRHPTVSREHARIFRRADGWRVADLNSSNGTFVNGAKVSVSPLKDGDTLRLGEVDLRVDFGAASPVDASAPDVDVDIDIDTPAEDDGDGGIVLEEPAVHLDEPANTGVPDQTMIARPQPMFQARPSAAPRDSGLSERSQALLRETQAKQRQGGANVLSSDVGQYSGGRQILMVVIAIAVAVGLFLAVMRLTETVVPEGDGVGAPPAATPGEDG